METVKYPSAMGMPCRPVAKLERNVRRRWGAGRELTAEPVAAADFAAVPGAE